MQSTPVILGQLRDMQVMDALLRIFFSNFTITPTKEDTFKGSDVAYNLKEPWSGFLKDEKLVHGALDALCFEHPLGWINPLIGSIRQFDLSTDLII